MTKTLKFECSWCGKEIKGGAAPTSHGICPACVHNFFPENAHELGPMTVEDHGCDQDAGFQACPRCSYLCDRSWTKCPQCKARLGRLKVNLREAACEILSWMLAGAFIVLVCYLLWLIS